MSALEISKMLTMSTGHLRRSSLDWLAGDHVGLTVYPKDEWGFFVWVPDTSMASLKDKLEPHEYAEGVPNELIACLEFARGHGCEFVCFDCDSDLVEGLVIYEH